MRLLLTIPLCLLCASCFNARPAGYDGGDQRYQASAAEIFGGAVFSSDAAGISDQEIAAALDYRYDPQSMKRIALFPVGLRGRELIGRQESVLATFTQTAPDLTVVPLPEILLPPRPDAATLRALCARLQADTLLIYDIRQKIDYRSHLFRADEANFTLSLDYFLFDIRSGIIPRSHSFDIDLDAKQRGGQRPWQFIDEHFAELSLELIERMARDLAGLRLALG
jgi:hypothetical protein